MSELSTARIDGLRLSARQIVRKLGFMQQGLAGTDLSPSAVHTIIEIGCGAVSNASALGALLHLDKSSVSRLLQKLEAAGYIKAVADGQDRRLRQLELTSQGRRLLSRIEHFAREQMAGAITNLSAKETETVESGLALFARALGSQSAMSDIRPPHGVFHQGYRAGLIGSVAGLHATFYAQNYSFGAVFERKVATEMAEFIGRIDRPANAIFSAYQGQDLLGSVSIDGEDLGQGEAHLRWFIVSPNAHGMGVGTTLISNALAFVDDYGFSSTRLWTFRGLDAARHLYEKNGFQLVNETPGTQWGTQVIEQGFVRITPGN